MLNNQYLLKKGSLIQIATGVLHFDTDTWGADANVFNSQRFVNKDALAKEIKKAQNQAFIPFGGGKSMCPGRYLAFTEITSFAAMLVYGFDVSSVDGSALSIPERRFQKMGINSRSPKDDMDVLIQRRKGFENVTWKFNTGSDEN
jgi:cytochrome P450